MIGAAVSAVAVITAGGKTATAIGLPKVATSTGRDPSKVQQ